MWKLTNCEYSPYLHGRPFPTDIRYIVDYTFVNYTDPNSPRSKFIDAESIWVLSFGIWKPEMLPMLVDQLVEPRGFEETLARYQQKMR